MMMSNKINARLFIRSRLEETDNPYYVKTLLVNKGFTDEHAIRLINEVLKEDGYTFESYKPEKMQTTISLSKGLKGSLKRFYLRDKYKEGKNFPTNWNCILQELLLKARLADKYIFKGNNITTIFKLYAEGSDKTKNNASE